MAKKSLQDINPLEYDLSTNVSVSPKQQTDRLIQLGKGVYKDKISGKLLYNYDEMPTAEIVGHKKEKSINDNLQKAYAKGIPSGTMTSDMETMNAVTGGALNLISPSQVVGAAIHSDKPQDYFLNLLKGNNGIVTDNFNKNHPYWSIAANGAFDGFTGRSLYNINYWNQTKPLLTSIGKGIGKTIVEVPYNIATNKNVQTYGRKIVNPILDSNYTRDIKNPIETIKAIKDGRYTPFMTKPQAKIALRKNKEALQKIFDDAYNFNKSIEANKSQPINIDEQYKVNIDNWDKAWESDDILNLNNSPYKNDKPTLHIDPLKDKKGQKFYDATAYYSGNDIYIPSRIRASKHILTDPNSFKTRRILSHEINHHLQDVIPKYRDIGYFDKNVGYYVVNENNDLANKIFAPIKKNSLKEITNWSGSPYEVQSDMAGLKYILNNPTNYSNQPWYNKLYMKRFISKRFNISSSEADKMLNDMSRHSFAMGGHINN